MTEYTQTGVRPVAITRHRFRPFSQNFKKRILASSCLSVRLSAWDSSAAATGGILIKFDVLRIFRKFVEKIQISLKSDMNNRYFTRRPMYIYDSISLNFRVSS